VRLQGSPEGTRVVVDGDVVLAGALGSVGQKVVAKHATKVTAEFAANLQRALNGEAPIRVGAAGGAGVGGDASSAAKGPATSAAPAGAQPTFADVVAGPVGRVRPPPPDRWSRIAAGLSGASVVLSLIALLRQRRSSP
jgi:hypothetical protein